MDKSLEIRGVMEGDELMGSYFIMLMGFEVRGRLNE